MARWLIVVRLPEVCATEDRLNVFDMFADEMRRLFGESWGELNWTIDMGKEEG